MIVVYCSILLGFAALAAFVYLAPARAVALALDATRKRSGLVRKEIELQDGLRFVYLEGGQGEPLMLLHGFGGNKDTFTRVARFLVKHYRVIIPDITGFGESARPPAADYSPSAQVHRLQAFSQALHLNSLHLGGNSMGAQIALEYTTLHPDKVNSLWLISPSGVWSVPGNNVLKVFREEAYNPLITRNVEEFKSVMALGMRRPPYIPKPMLRVLAQERIHNAALEERIFQQLLEHSVEDRVRGMETPALIVFGSQDRVIPHETAHVLNELLPGSRVVFVRNAGHVSMFEKPGQCARDYVTFRESIMS